MMIYAQHQIHTINFRTFFLLWFSNILNKNCMQPKFITLRPLQQRTLTLQTFRFATKNIESASKCQYIEKKWVPVNRRRWTPRTAFCRAAYHLRCNLQGTRPSGPWSTRGTTTGWGTCRWTEAHPIPSRRPSTGWGTVINNYSSHERPKRRGLHSHFTHIQPFGLFVLWWVASSDPTDCFEV